VFKKLRQVHTIVNLRPPHAQSLRADKQIRNLLRCRVVQFIKHLPRDQHLLTITQAQPKELDFGVNVELGLDDPWKIVERLRSLERFIDLFVRSQIKRMSFHVSSPKAPASRARRHMSKLSDPRFSVKHFLRF
jgi:hypothetical protein